MSAFSPCGATQDTRPPFPVFSINEAVPRPGVDGCYVKLFLSLHRCRLSEEESALEIMISLSPGGPRLRVHVIS